jgi:hypothetical protein
MRAGGKEELRASVLKTYLLRLRADKGERAVRALLLAAGIDPAAVDNETGWLSQIATKRALKALKDELGLDALKRRSEWTTNAEALGTLVRMLRNAEHPVDAYRYLANNAKEVTRVGTWDIDEPPARDKDRAGITHVKMTYRVREDADEGSDQDADGEDLLCAAREGELASYPRIWGLADAEIGHATCLAKGDDACVYEVSWSPVSTSRRGAILGAFGAGIVSGGSVAAAGGAVAARSSARRSEAAQAFSSTARKRIAARASSRRTGSRRSSVASSSEAT